MWNFTLTLNVLDHWEKGWGEGEGNCLNNSSCREKDSCLIASAKSDKMG